MDFQIYSSLMEFRCIYFIEDIRDYVQINHYQKFIKQCIQQLVFGGLLSVLLVFWDGMDLQDQQHQAMMDMEDQCFYQLWRAQDICLVFYYHYFVFTKFILLHLTPIKQVNQYELNYYKICIFMQIVRNQGLIIFSQYMLFQLIHYWWRIQYLRVCIMKQNLKIILNSIHQMSIQRKGFSWTPTTSTLKTKSTYMSLRQTVTPNQGPVYLTIDTERELQYTSDLGWNWHKSWNIPNISVKMRLTNEENTQWINCQAQLMAVKVISSDVFEEVGLEGITQQELHDGKAFFSGVKFNSTTYNHQGHRFQLLVLIKEGENIIAALQSPPVFVDSRKSARDEHRQIQYLQPFEPKYLERNFCKKEKHFNDVVDAPIENNENGLHNYLTAPNIRNKIKHPLFMALKFSKCLNIYHQNILETDNYLIEFQKQLMSKTAQSQFAIVFQSNNNRIRRKIEESLTQLFIQSKIQVIERKYLDEINYTKLEFTSEDYSKVYNDLNEIMNAYTMEQQIENEEHPIQQQIVESPQPQTHQERKSAFKKYKDFDKMPTKNFEEEKLEQQQRMEKLNNIREMEQFDRAMKQVKLEDNPLNIDSIQQQTHFMNSINQLSQLSPNYTLLLQQKMQEQLLQYYFIQQQLMLLQMAPKI